MKFDERLAAVWMDWWWNEPMTDDEFESPTTPESALRDLQTLVRRLEANGYQIVATKTPNNPNNPKESA